MRAVAEPKDDGNVPLALLHGADLGLVQPHLEGEIFLRVPLLWITCRGSLPVGEYVHPHALGDGPRLVERVGSGPREFGSALIVLLAASSVYGGDIVRPVRVYPEKEGIASCGLGRAKYREPYL